MELKQLYAHELSKHIGESLTVTELEELIEKPKYAKQGDLAFPCFALAKIKRQSPVEIAKGLAQVIHHTLFAKIEANGPYVNCFFDKHQVSAAWMKQILLKGNHYGDVQVGNGEQITIDFSSPNIAKPFSMGHLRSTVIGNALANIVEKCGYHAVRINHLGDWGTQFGKLITAYKHWGVEEKVKANPIPELLKLYVEFHEKAIESPALEDEARAWFKKLEDGEAEAHQLWEWFRDVSLQEFNRIYELLGIHFDSYHGEAFYNDKMERTVELLQEKGLLSPSKGAEVVRLDEYDLPPCLIKKSDGATLYATRDLTAARYRQDTYHFAKAIYVVGQEQQLHFRQVFLTLEKMNYPWAKDMVHVPFGFILKNGKKMSTRKGKVVLLEKVIEEAIELAAKNIEAKNPTLKNKHEVAKQVGVGAIIFQDLRHERQNHIEFSLEGMLKFEGMTGPYVQYTHARACSILANAAAQAIQPSAIGLTDDYSWAVIKQLMAFPNAIETAFKQFEPSEIAKYVFQLSQEFNKYYNQVKVLQADEHMQGRLALVQCVTIVLKEGLRLLGLKAPESM